MWELAWSYFITSKKENLFLFFLKSVDELCVQNLSCEANIVKRYIFDIEEWHNVILSWGNKYTNPLLRKFIHIRAIEQIIVTGYYIH